MCSGDVYDTVPLPTAGVRKNPELYRTFVDVANSYGHRNI